jgi:hypothetical protein
MANIWPYLLPLRVMMITICQWPFIVIEIGSTNHAISMHYSLDFHLKTGKTSGTEDF